MTRREPAQPIMVFSHPLSGHAHRVRLLLSILGLPHLVTHVDMDKREHKSPEYLARNPLGQVPVIEDGDVTVFDSNAILVYLATKYDDGTWLPRDPLLAAQVQRWLSMAAGPVAFGLARARQATVFNVPVDVDQARTVALKMLAAVEQEMSSKLFAVGAHATIADVAAYAYFRLSFEGGIPLDEYPNIRAWLARIEGLRGFVPIERFAPELKVVES